MSLLNTLEEKFGRFAMPKIVTVIAGFQVLNWFLLKVVPSFSEKLMFDPDAIMQGEVWRLVSYVLLPGSTGLMWLICIGFLFMLNDGLEEAWGSFRLNLFVLGGIVAITIGGLLFGFTTSGLFMWSGVLWAFARYFPNQEVMLYFVIPIKIKWLAWGYAALLLLIFVNSPVQRWEVFFSVLNYLVVFAPGFLRDLRHQSKVTSRRRRFESAQPAEDEALHRCVKCGRTDTLNPYLEFRVNAQGEDICKDCRAAGK